MNIEMVQLIFDAIQTIVAILAVITTIIIHKDRHPRE